MATRTLATRRRPSRDPVDPRTKRIYDYHRRHKKTPTEAFRLTKHQRTVRMVGQVGDVNWPEYDGGPIVKDSDGRYSLEYVIPPEDGVKRYTVYRVDLDREPLPKWIDASGVAQSAGMSPSILRMYWRSLDPRKRAHARLTVAGHYGWHELDQYPLRLTRSEVRTRYRR